MKRFSTRLAALAIAALSVAAAVPAHAEQTSSAVELRYTYDASAAPDRLYRAFEQQARKFCDTGLKGVHVQRKVEAPCRAQLMDQFVSGTRNGQLAEIHVRKTGRSAPSVALASLALSSQD
jgi:hypothetical protein